MAQTEVFWYPSPLGELLLASDGAGLTGLWFAGAKYFGAGLSPRALAAAQALKARGAPESAVLRETAGWLDAYFAGRAPGKLPPLHPAGTAFRQEVWARLLEIPYGRAVTYGQLARELAQQRGLPHLSAQAVGGAVGHNPISIIIPCHRVLGADGSLTGYAGGLDKKRALLMLEGWGKNGG